ncbi:ribonucleoside-diphosphate reductase subunit alpha (Ribonucleotide reductase) [Sulfurihydrogenibium azorense Az-Fu1]|uniref:Ribonucleoside-diphosphate reductase n=1 Tax=Sulfurihydrogenibium azorense (strain DSM 15241 / OCM 825 / Az-Fu1) TaxID=204536 RepID=C1DWR9_SULAA|nr:ribonucleoside-diphosphate reductase subunit alpha [Sulfurihydrogenibium azorense]ACN98635.1 ribonucleoside-diphosphate reductase subunit alpha (Ribonucleotide reductase) [Sulfurihydrogenibium azorense Az-Fu1]
MQRIVVKRDGSVEKFQMKKLVDAIFALLEGLELPDDYEIVFKVAKELDLKIPEKVTTEELDYLVLKAIEHLIPKNYIYDTLATRQLLKIINRRIDRRFNSFKDYINYAVEEKLLKPELLQFDIDRLEKSIDYSRDYNLDYFGLSTLKDRYLMKDRDFETIEKPQWFFMRVAMGIGNTEDEIIKIYNKLSNLEYLHSTPTLFNSGTLTNQYSSCFPAGTPVITIDGVKNIEDVKIGDVVLTAEGNYKVVSGLFSRKYQRELYKLYVWGLWGREETVKATDDHRFLVLKKEDVECDRKFVKVCPPYQNTEKCYPVKRQYAYICEEVETNLLENLKWVEAKDIEAGDYIVIPYPKGISEKVELNILDYIDNPYLVEKDGYIHKINHDKQKRTPEFNGQINKVKSKIKIDYDFMRFLGYYLAEGYINKSGNKLSTVFTFGVKDKEFIEDVISLSKKLFDINPTVAHNKDNSVRITLNSTYLSQFIKNLVGTGFNKKILPPEIMLAHPEVQKGLIVGLFRGDATAVKDGYRLTLSNKSLIYQIFHILLRIGSLPRISKASKNHLATEDPYSVYISINDSEDLIRLINKDTHKITAKPDKTKINSYRFKYKDVVFYKITKVEKEIFDGTVYDFEVKGDHSFAANLVAAHNCYVNVIDDSLESIMDKAKETAFLAKYAGGVGTDVTRIRATGSKIHSLNAKSSGIIPFIKIFDTIVNAIQQGGRRRSSQVMYLQPWHLDVEAFLDLRETTGNPYFRTPSLNTALWMPDELMRRIKEGEPIYLFDPAECPKLVTAWGEEFKKEYESCIEKAEKGELKLWKKIDSRDFYKKYLFKLAKTGHPWLTFKDRHNEKNPCPQYSVINSSNLCTEISIPNSPESTAVCTLASVNLARHVKEDKSDFDWDKLKDTLETMVVALDNILDKNFYPSEESRKNTMDLRPIGIGVMGFHEALIKLGIPYDSDKAVETARKIAKFMREVTYAKSEELAKERGAFPHYYEANYNYPPRRNAVLLAVAPTASISIIAGTSSSIDNYFSNIFSRDTLSGKFIVINKPLMKELEEKGLWSEELAEKIKAHQGSIQYIEELDGKIDKSLYKTAYEVSPYRQIDIAAAFQEYIDQAVSKSLYIEEDLRDKMEDIYMYAWEKGLKSTYYCFIDKTVKGEKYTLNVNKRGERRGFGLAKRNDKELEKELEEIERQAREKYGDEVVDAVKSGNIEGCPTDPLLAKICPSCE